ncbi:hypothetical protein QCN27_17745 [Cereibacter sp. SYSU M97828]|nr:hypothetical protein [Cereibacter flavus]
MATYFSSAFLNAALAAAISRLNGGKLRVLTAANAPIGEMVFGTPAFAAPVEGVAMANAMTSGTAAAGNAAKYQAISSAGTVEFEGDVIAGDEVPENALALLRLDFVGGEELKPISFEISVG